MDDVKIFDVVVIGAGSAGLTAAISLSAAGKSVLLIERDLPGGECTHSGCVPSKALLHATKSGTNNSRDALRYVRDKIAEIYSEETPAKLTEHGITLTQGDATFHNKNSVSVNNTIYQFKKCIIASGSSPRTLDIPGLDDAHVLTNQNFFQQESLPKKLLIIGSGPIGMEMAQAAAMLGSHVTTVTNASRLGHLEDPAVSAIIQQSFDELGITCHYNSEVDSVTGTSALIHGNTEQQIDFDKVLIAIGRVPNLPQGLSQAGVQSNKHGIAVNKNYQTTNRHIYATGDVSQQMKFTHTANDTTRSVVKHILTKGLLGHKQTAIPKVTYTTPEIASVGMSYNEAVERYGSNHVIRIETSFNTNDRAKIDQQSNGLCIVVARRLSGRLLGANIVGAHAGELLASYTLAINNRISLWKLSKTIYPYPTLSQIVKKSADQFAVVTLRNIKSELWNYSKQWIVKLFALVFWSGLLYGLWSWKSSQGLTNFDLLRSLYEFMVGSFWGPFIYMLAYVLRPLIFFPATVLTALSGALFGLPLGILFTVIGENGSANLAYWIGRFFGNNSHIEDNRLLGPFVNKAQDQPFITVLLMRFLYVPFDLTNYGSGIMNIPWRSYALATLIGIMPGLVTFVALGASLDIETILGAEKVSDLVSSINPWMLICSLLLFIGSIILARYFRYQHTR